MFPDLRFDCPPRRGLGVGVAVVAIGLGLFLLPEATSGRWLLTIGPVSLSAAHSRVAMIFLSAVGVGTGLMSAAHVGLRVAQPMSVVLGHDSLYGPRHLWSLQLTRVRYADVRSAVVDRSGNGTYLRVGHAGGRLSLRAVDFPSPAEFAACVAEFRRRLAVGWPSTGRRLAVDWPWSAGRS